MSFNNMRVGGLATGMDIYSIVNDLMRVRRLPVDKLNQQRQILQWQQEDLRSVNNTLRNFRDKVFDMRLQRTFLAREAISSNENAVKVSANSEAVEGTYAFKVNNLAKGAYLNSSADIAGYTDGQKLFDQFQEEGIPENIEFTISNGSFAKTFAFDTKSTSIYDVVSAINNAKDAEGNSLGIKASYDQNLNRFFLMTTKTGTGQKILWEDTSGSFLQHSLKLPAGGASGVDASVTLNGLTFTRPTNNFTVNGITFNIQAVGETTVTIKNDTEAVFNNIKNFVTAYNETMSAVRSKLTEARYRDYQPLTDLQREQLTDKQIDQWEEKSRSGHLRNDPMLGNLHSSLRTLMSSTVSGLDGSTLKSLAAIGISTTAYYQSSDLVINEDKLRRAIQENPEAVMQLFTRQAGVGEDKNHNGIAHRLYDEVNSTMRLISDRAGSSDSLTRVDNSAMGKNVGRINKEISSWEDRLKQIEERYWRQFTAMEKAINQMNSQSTWLAQQLGGLGGK